MCCLPHARGGVSQLFSVSLFYLPSSPRPWGCFRTKSRARPRRAVFPTHVGVFLLVGGHQRLRNRLPHARGGVSLVRRGGGRRERSSPRPWGCFQDFDFFPAPRNLFPSPVGVFLINGRDEYYPVALPHARGGVSISWSEDGVVIDSSPRPWGCFSTTI